MISMSAVFPAAPADPTSSALVIRAYDSDVEGDDLMFSKDWAWTNLPTNDTQERDGGKIQGQGGARAAAMNVAAELAKLDYVELFLTTRTAQMDRLWTAANGPRDLEALAMDPETAWKPRFLAAEILFRKRPTSLRWNRSRRWRPSMPKPCRLPTWAMSGSAGRARWSRRPAPGQPRRTRHTPIDAASGR